MLRAKVSQVNIGPLSVEGLMDEKGGYHVAIPQIADRFQFDKNQASRYLKSLLGGSFQFDKAKTELNPKEVNVVPLDVFEKIVFELALSGNLKAIDFSRALIGLSLHQLFCDAFHVKFEAEDRQKYLIERAVHRTQYHPLVTSWLQKDGCTLAWEYGKKINEFKSASGLPITPITQYTPNELSKLNRVEGMYDIMRRAGHNHSESIKLLK